MDVEEIRDVKSIVIERVDLCFSLGLSSDDVNQPQINKLVESALLKIKKRQLLTTIGGGVSADSFAFFRSLPVGTIDRIETRKVTFDYRKMMSGQPEKAIMAALAFELFFLKNKMSFYKNVAAADLSRLEVIEQRYWHQINTVIPTVGSL